MASRAFQTSAANCSAIGELVPGMGGVERLDETLDRKTSAFVTFADFSLSIDCLVALMVPWSFSFYSASFQLENKDLSNNRKQIAKQFALK